MRNGFSACATGTGTILATALPVAESIIGFCSVALRTRGRTGAEKLGVKLPAWVARHGSRRSSAAVLNTVRIFRIILTNAVKYVTNVDAYDRRIQSPINIQERSCCGARSSF